MNYLYINGVRSNNVRGLIISDFSPIVKPKMRYQAESVDGQDGANINLLGYEPYKRTINIGLAGDYNIDDVIEYFNQSGEIVFSNEPNKIYKFHALDGVSYESLLRFKTAKINILVQPFKYLKDEEPIVCKGECIARNIGNTYARPVVKLKGKGKQELYINDELLLKIDLKDGSNITIDTANLEAYDDKCLRNRDVDGEYDKVILKKGKNTVKVVGDLEELRIEQYSRWL